MYEKKKKRDLAAIASIPLIMTLANSMLIPVLPLMQRKLGIASWQASLIITVYAAVSIVCIPVAGYLSDRFGRKRIILIGLSIALAGGLVSGLAAWLLSQHASFAWILMGRFIQGIGAAGAFPIVIPLVGDMFKEDEQVSSGLGMVESSNTLGKVVSPIAGSALAYIVWFLPLIVIPFICLISIIAVAVCVKAPVKKQADVSLKRFIDDVKSILSVNGKWLYTIFVIGCLVMYVMFGILYDLSSMLEDKHNIHGIKKGFMLAIPLSAICLASFIVGKKVGQNKAAMKWLTVSGTALLTAAMAIITATDPKGIIWLIILVSAGGAGIGLALPSLDALITEGIEKQERGTITSLYSSMRFIGVAAGPLLASVMLNRNALLYGGFAVAAALCCTLALCAIRPGKSEKKAATGGGIKSE